MCIPLPTPGILTVALALFAAVISMPPFNKWLEKESLQWLRAICIGVFFLLAAGEIYVIRTTDKKQHEEHLADLRAQETRFEQEMSFLSDFRESVETKLGIANKLYAKAKAQPVPDSLKVDTLQLVRDIFQFSADREKQQPAYSVSMVASDRQRESEAFDKWRNETIAEYISQFDPRLVAIAGRLAAKGIDTGHLLFQCLKPVNTLMIPTCASELQRLADKLP